jgi:hypothetical protein
MSWRSSFSGSFACAALVWALCSWCACASAPGRVTRTLPLPDERATRDRTLEQLGARAFLALREGSGRALLLDEQALGVVLEPEAAARIQVVRAARPAGFATPSTMLADASYRGVCLQGARLEPAGPSLGLRQPGFVATRALVESELPDHSRIAAWVEGTFLLTDQGFFALSIGRVESPRRDHADLDLAVCDLEIGRATPRPVVVGVGQAH